MTYGTQKQRSKIVFISMHKDDDALEAQQDSCMDQSIDAKYSYVCGGFENGRRKIKR